mmetsp:Transcript_36912/g.75210  ORF Transcript_36912/g.75210 Transcript_36912/m.75210 type:complete len:250 (-) Transcript_36912:958-1707(-)
MGVRGTCDCPEHLSPPSGSTLRKNNLFTREGGSIFASPTLSSLFFFFPEVRGVVLVPLESDTLTEHRATIGVDDVLQKPMPSANKGKTRTCSLSSTSKDAASAEETSTLPKTLPSDPVSVGAGAEGIWTEGWSSMFWSTPWRRRRILRPLFLPPRFPREKPHVASCLSLPESLFFPRSWGGHEHLPTGLHVMYCSTISLSGHHPIDASLISLVSGTGAGDESVEQFLPLTRVRSCYEFVEPSCAPFLRS